MFEESLNRSDDESTGHVLPRSIGKQLPIPEGASDHERLAISVANFAAGLLSNGHYPRNRPMQARDVVWFGNSTLTGYRAAASDLLALLAQFPECRKALVDLGLEKFFQEVGRE